MDKDQIIHLLYKLNISSTLVPDINNRIHGNFCQDGEGALFPKK